MGRNCNISLKQMILNIMLSVKMNYESYELCLLNLFILYELILIFRMF